MTDTPDLTDPATSGFRHFTDGTGAPVEVPSDLVFGEEGEADPIPFVVNGEVFYAAAAIPANDWGTLASLYKEFPRPAEGEERTPDDVVRLLKLVGSMMELFMLPESAARLTERLTDKERPIDLKKLMAVIGKFLNEVYLDPEDGEGRPTPPTSG